MKLYEINQAGYNSLPVLTKEERKKALDIITQYIKDTHGDYYMMLNHDVRYYTIFDWELAEYLEFAQEVMSVAESLGVVKAVEISENNAMIEIWITNIMTNECHMYGFFVYDKGVIKI